MAYDEGLAGRLREVYDGESDVAEQSMFGGIAFMVNGHMSCGVTGDNLVVRVGPTQYAEALKMPHAREMNFNGRPLKGFVYVAPVGVESDEDLLVWVSRSLDFVKTLPAK